MRGGIESNEKIMKLV
jgi:hypothetical protein